MTSERQNISKEDVGSLEDVLGENDPLFRKGQAMTDERLTSENIAHTFISCSNQPGLVDKHGCPRDWAMRKLKNPIEVYGDQRAAEARKAALAWTNTKPTTTGYYLRNNPAVKVIVRQGVYKMPGCGDKLFTSDSQGMGRAIPLEELSDTFLWYGPIPTEGLPRWDEDSQLADSPVLKE